MKKNLLVFGSLALVVLTGVTGCKSNDGPAMPQEEVIKDSTKSGTLSNLNLIMSNIPAPSAISKELVKEGIQVNSSILNTPDKASSYSGNFSQAINMGIYGADMGYLASYNQMQQATSYMIQVAKLAQSLGITSAYDQKLMEQFKSATTNKDSIDIVMQTAFDRAQKELYSNKRASTSTLIFAGGWIEGLYIATNLVKDEKNDKNKDLYGRIWSHVYAFNYLQKVLTDYKASSPDCANLLGQLQPLFDAASKLSDSGLSLSDVQNLKQTVTGIRSKLI
ncbi:MAG TPA: hypothetical protein VNY36_07935 [Bacteroidia bacterium]|jgi:hypothetical protein|nr:hypothetical protein [Bacteroidia bacterium]